MKKLKKPMSREQYENRHEYDTQFNMEDDRDRNRMQMY